MKVEGLTIYHVKSHLQVYFLLVLDCFLCILCVICFCVNFYFDQRNCFFNYRSIGQLDTDLSHPKVYNKFLK